jgi:hypothetical protein
VSLGYQASPLVVLSALLLTDKPWFLTEGKDLPLCSLYFPLGVSQLSGHNHHQLHASHHAPTLRVHMDATLQPARRIIAWLLQEDAVFFREHHYLNPLMVDDSDQPML